jgi:hypothetical protein
VGHSLGLKADGSVVAWGDNSWGQGNVPVPNVGFVAVAAGSVHTLGIKGISSGEGEPGLPLAPGAVVALAGLLSIAAITNGD